MTTYEQPRGGAAVKSRPILFRGDMVRAILDGRKTQTRRVARHRDLPQEFHDEALRVGVERAAKLFLDRCPYGVPGDELWVRETWGVGSRSDPVEGWYDGVEYKADCHRLYEDDDLPLRKVDAPDDVDLESLLGPWRSPILMPRWASRLTLVVRSVRVERLSDISVNDVCAEGFDWDFDFPSAFRAMHKLAPDADPWLWVVGFEVKP